VVAAIGALGLGGAAIAGAADNGSSSSAKSSQDRASRPQRQALSSAVAAKVEAAALAKVPGATVLRTEAGGPYATAYHAHVEQAEGTRSVVVVDKSFKATAVQADRGRGPGGPDGGRGGDHGGAGETALTGTTKEKVEAAALTELPGGCGSRRGRTAPGSSSSSTSRS